MSRIDLQGQALKIWDPIRPGPRGNKLDFGELTFD